MFHLQNKAFEFCCHYIFPKAAELWLDLDLDWQLNICNGFGLDWQSKRIELSNSLDRLHVNETQFPNMVQPYRQGPKNPTIHEESNRIE